MPGYRVTIGDAFQLTKPEQPIGSFGTASEAIAAAQALVDAALKQLYRPGMTADDLLQDYFVRGRDPVVVPAPGDAPVAFSAWDHAAARAAILCRESQNDVLSR
jgi:hypothetical protein